MEAARKPSSFVSPRPRTRPQPPITVAPPEETAHAESGHTLGDQPLIRGTSASRLQRTSTRTKRVKAEKHIADGDHDVGYCRPPKEHRFKPGNEGGPGRKKGSKSQNSMLRAEFERRHPVREGGKTTKKQARELISTLVVTGPISSRDHRHVAQLNALAQQLYPEPVTEAAVTEAHDPALDQLVLRHLFAALQLGDGNEEGEDPFADVATGQPDLGQPVGGDAWDEGDWDANGQEVSDEDR